MNAQSTIAIPLCDIRLPAALDAVSAELSALSEAIARASVREDTRDDLMVVLAEVMNNIVLHAYGGGTGWIEVSVRRVTDRLEVETRDAGRPLPPVLLQGGTLPPEVEVPDDLPEGGFGWFLIHSLVNDMIYERAEGENRLSFSLAA